MPPSKAELSGSTRVISTPLVDAGSCESRGHLAVDELPDRQPKRRIGVASRCGRRRGSRRLRLRPIPARTFGQLHHDVFLAAVADDTRSWTAEPGAWPTRSRESAHRRCASARRRGRQDHVVGRGVRRGRRRSALDVLNQRAAVGRGCSDPLEIDVDVPRGDAEKPAATRCPRAAAAAGSSAPVDRHRKADVAGARADRRVDADHLAARVDQRPPLLPKLIAASVWM